MGAHSPEPKSPGWLRQSLLLLRHPLCPRPKPLAAIGADVMVGFPGESDADFEESRSFIAELPFTYLHVFTFSARPGTPAAVLPNHVHGGVAGERNRVLRDLAAEKNRRFRESFVGGTLNAVTLAHHKGNADSTEALTDNYLKL